VVERLEEDVTELSGEIRWSSNGNHASSFCAKEFGGAKIPERC